jgi:hypothetical protein
VHSQTRINSCTVGHYSLVRHVPNRAQSHPHGPHPFQEGAPSASESTSLSNMSSDRPPMRPDVPRFSGFTEKDVPAWLDAFDLICKACRLDPAQAFPNHAQSGVTLRLKAKGASSRRSHGRRYGRWSKRHMADQSTRSNCRYSCTADVIFQQRQFHSSLKPLTT